MSRPRFVVLRPAASRCGRLLLGAGNAAIAASGAAAGMGGRRRSLLAQQVPKLRRIRVQYLQPLDPSGLCELTIECCEDD